MYKFSNSVCCALGGVCIINMANSVVRGKVFLVQGVCMTAVYVP